MRGILISTASALLALTLASGVVAAGNPAGTGQPSQSCGSATATMQPAGFGTAGFTHAATVYAGSPGTPSAANGNSTAVSQYDVACYQITQHH